MQADLGQYLEYLLPIFCSIYIDMTVTAALIHLLCTGKGYKSGINCCEFLEGVKSLYSENIGG